MKMWLTVEINLPVLQSVLRQPAQKETPL